MTWTMLALFVLVSLAFGVSRRASLPYPFPRSARFTATGVEGVRKLSRQTKAALDAATDMLH